MIAMMMFILITACLANAFPAFSWLVFGIFIVIFSAIIFWMVGAINNQAGDFIKIFRAKYPNAKPLWALIGQNLTPIGIVSLGDDGIIVMRSNKFTIYPYESIRRIRFNPNPLLNSVGYYIIDLKRRKSVKITISPDTEYRYQPDKQSTVKAGLLAKSGLYSTASIEVAKPVFESIEKNLAKFEDMLRKHHVELIIDENIGKKKRNIYKIGFILFPLTLLTLALLTAYVNHDLWGPILAIVFLVSIPAVFVFIVLAVLSEN